MRNAIRPAVVDEGRDQRQSSRLGGMHPPRPYYCRECGREESASYVPGGWYSLSRGGRRLGLYCTLGCLAANMPRIEITERRKREDAGGNDDEGAYVLTRHERHAPTEGMGTFADAKRMGRFLDVMLGAGALPPREKGADDAEAREPSRSDTRPDGGKAGNRD